MSLKSSLLALSLAIKTATTTNFNTATRIGTLFQSIISALTETYDVTAYGAVGDGVTAAATEAAGFAAAAAAAALVGGKVYVPKGTYGDSANWTFALPSGVTLEGDGDLSVLKNCYITCTGTAGAEIPFTAPAAKGATSISIPATGLTDSWLRLASCINMQSTDAGREQLGHDPTAAGFFAEYVQVKQGNVGTADLLGGTMWAYSNTPGGDSGTFTTSVARVMSFHTGGRIRRLRMLGKNTAQNHSILATFAKDLLIEDVSLDANDATDQVIRFLYCLDCTVAHSRVVGKKTTVPGGSTANCIVFLSSQGCDADDCSLYNGNQGVDVDCMPNDATYRGGPSVFCGAINSRAFDNATEGFTSHWGCFGSFFDTCAVKGSPRGIRVRDRGFRVVNCRMAGPNTAGIGLLIDEAAWWDGVACDNTVVGYSYNIQVTHSSTGYATLQSTLGCGSTIIDGNTLRDAGDHGIYLNVAYTAATLCGPRITRNEISNPVSNGIQINSYFNGTVVDDNRVNGVASGKAAVRWGANIKRLHVANTHAYGVNAAGFVLQGAGTASFMTDAATFPAGESEAQLFVGDVFTDAATPFQSIVRLDACYAAPKRHGYGGFTAPMSTSGPTAERQTFGFYLSGSSLRADTRDTSNNFVTHQLNIRGAGTPEGAVTAAVGSTYQRTDGGAGTSFYVKESGAGNTGWVAK